MKVLKGQENLLLKILQVKTCIENVRFLSWRIFFVGKYGIQSTNEMAFKRIVTLRASFRFPAIRFDAPTLLSFSGFTHAHAKCPPVFGRSLPVKAMMGSTPPGDLHYLKEKLHVYTINDIQLLKMYRLSCKSLGEQEHPRLEGSENLIIL